jgi:hypothetical protein
MCCDYIHLFNLVKMKKYLFIFGLLMTNQLFAQFNPLSDLHSTSSPALILMDKAPSSIDKPVNPKTFGLSLYNLADGGSLECTPYWFFHHPEYTFDKHLKNRHPILQTLNLSMGTFKEDSLSLLGIGFRTQLLKKYDKATLLAIDKKTKDIKNEIIEDNINFQKVNMLLDDLQELTTQTRWTIELVAAATGSYLNHNIQQTTWSQYG